MCFNSDYSKAQLPSALILGLGNHGLALIRSLGRKGIHVEVVDSNLKQFQRHSRYCKACHQVKSLDDESLISFLTEFAKKNVRRWVLFITKDKTVPVISRAREILGRYYYFNLPEDEKITMLMDKQRLAHFLETNACSVPKTMPIKNLHDIACVGKEIGYPCLIKPGSRTYGFKASKVLSEKELKEAYTKASKYTNRLIVQEWIHGPDTEIYFCFVYMDFEGELKAAFVGQEIRKFFNQTGIACATERCYDEFVLEESKRLFRLADYRGFGSTEFKRDPNTGVYKFIEFTVGRTDYDLETAIANGIDLPFIGYCDMIGMMLPPYRQVQKERRMRWVDFARDMKAIRQEYVRGQYGFSRMIKNMASDLGPGTVHAFFAWDDLRPFLMYMLDRVFAVFRKICKLAGFYKPQEL